MCYELAENRVHVIDQYLLKLTRVALLEKCNARRTGQIRLCVAGNGRLLDRQSLLNKPSLDP